MSPDWSAQATPIPYANLADPQSLNLYAYAGNNPIRQVDPDGHLGLNNGSPGGCFPNASGSSCADTEADQQTKNNHTQQQNSNQEKRDALAANAEAQKGSTSWAYDAKPCGNKCSKFVGDMLSLIGIGIKQGYKSDPDAPPVAGDWLNPKATIAKWQVLKSGQAPMPGDIAAEAINDPHAGATAHMGIVISNGHGGITAIAAGHHSVYRTNEFFDPTHVVTFRRYTGD